MGYLLGRGLTTQTSVGLWNTSLAEILLRKNIGCNLAPLFGNLYVSHFKNNFTGWITNHRSTIVILKLIKHIHIITGEAAAELQTAFSVCGLLCGHTRKEFIGFWSGFEKVTALLERSQTKVFFNLTKTKIQIFTSCGKWSYDLAQPLPVADLMIFSHVQDIFLRIFFGNISPNL